MKYVTPLVLVGCAIACQLRPATQGTHRADSVDVAQLLPRDSSGSAFAVPRVIAAPSVVLFWLRAADTLSADDQADTFDDLKYSTAQVAPALEASGIGLVATSADTIYVSQPNERRRSILLSGLDYPFGYVLIDPGGPERILTGVYNEDELMDELRAYFDLTDDSTHAPPRTTT
ncbi:MAG TPA: hypothetical protein VHO95_03520 [Candidatus Dormibacteraeota bacterium]|nr:hypothetical protein [Candidatus Dormibacteraeota bacterium]